MNKPNEPIRPDSDLSDDVRDEILQRLETYPADKASARPAREALQELLKRPVADVPR